TNVIAPLSGTPLIFTGFYAFGSTVVFLMTIADFIASITNFWIAKRWGRSLVKKFVGQENIAKADRFTRSYGLLTLLLLRFFQGGVGDFISYAAGLTSMRFTPYLIISTAGMIPRTVLWYFLALHVKSPVVFTALTLLLIVVLSGIFLAGVAIKRLKR
ncbi:MAG: VTT domain-containing protein, partial [bacterium]|nr:VTT domain-containing protein [bacterium]